MIRVCGSDVLRDGGPGVRFEVAAAGRRTSAFVVRHRGEVRGFLNRCAHVAMELDWLPGEFFDAEGEYLICASHGALYDPGSGGCIGGPCLGRGGLQSLKVLERDGYVWWIPGDPITVLPPEAGPEAIP